VSKTGKVQVTWRDGITGSFSGPSFVICFEGISACVMSRGQNHLPMTFCDAVFPEQDGSVTSPHEP
jgi:hypothetical protein